MSWFILVSNMRFPDKNQVSNDSLSAGAEFLSDSDAVG